MQVSNSQHNVVGLVSGINQCEVYPFRDRGRGVQCIMDFWLGTDAGCLIATWQGYKHIAQLLLGLDLVYAI